MARIEQTKDSRDEVIRSRLLHSLGIHRTKPSGVAAPTSENPKLSGPRSTAATPRDVRMLSDDELRRSLNDSNEHNGNSRHPQSRKRLVRFNNVVTEKPIASHKKYSDRIRKHLWSDSEEIQENAYRNQIEYQAEGMNWQSVLENDEMYVDAKTGELIHPFWVESNDAKLFS